jgi:hypothetical protein
MPTKDMQVTVGGEDILKLYLFGLSRNARRILFFLRMPPPDGSSPHGV